MVVYDLITPDEIFHRGYLTVANLTHMDFTVQSAHTHLGTSLERVLDGCTF